jgi:hypothetical protein
VNVLVQIETNSATGRSKLTYNPYIVDFGSVEVVLWQPKSLDVGRYQIVNNAVYKQARYSGQERSQEIS